MDEKVDAGKKRDILDWNACCKSGAREKASKAFAVKIRSFRGRKDWLK